MRTPLLLALLACPCAAAWIGIDAGPVKAYSDSGERGLRQILARLELAARVAGRPNPLPVRVFLLSSGRFAAVRPGATTRGFYQGGPSRDSIVLPAGGDARVAVHEYTHMTLHHTVGPLPKWLEEGLAEFHSTVEEAGGKVRLGRPVEEHVRLLRTRPLLHAAEMGAAEPDPRKIGIFYAQSWALTHMLRLSEDYRAGYPAFFRAIAGGTPQGEAFQAAYQKTFSAVIGDLPRYLERNVLPVVELQMNAAAPLAAASIPLQESDGDTLYAQLARECGFPAEASRIYAKLARQRAGTAEGETAMGYVALGGERFDEARKHFERALAMGSRDASVAFELAMLVRDHDGGSAAARPLLERVVEWDPAFAEAQFLLGVDEAHQDRHAEAIERMKRAVAVFPRQSYFWHGLAMSYAALGKQDEARRAARRAVDSAQTPHHAEMASALLRGLDRQAAVTQSKKDAVIVPEGWKQKQGSARVEGVLEQIDCLGSSARFLVRSSKGVTALWVEKPGDVLMKNLSSLTFEFRCGVQKPASVAIEYEPKPDGEKMTVGVMTAIEFR